jgi:hypothetical protein
VGAAVAVVSDLEAERSGRPVDPWCGDTSFMAFMPQRTAGPFAAALIELRIAPARAMERRFDANLRKH